jgi:hypothetical protein
MKKFIIALTFMTNLYVANAQSNVKFGLKAGANFSTWTGQQAAGSSLRPGFHAGGFAAIPVNASLAFKPELLLSSEGIKVASNKYIVDYIRLPLLLQYRHASGFELETGPQLGFAIKGKLKTDVEETDIKNQLPPLEASWGIGVGYALKSGPGFNIRYNFGISELGSKENSLKTAVISAGLFYVFGGR